MTRIVECVPNFSEGRDEKKISLISESIREVPGIRLLDVDPGAATNRTVFTFAGSPEDALEAAFRSIRKASEIIDMSKHQGAHPRQGACDVCPFIPVSGVSFEECIALSHKLAERVGTELSIPVYLYGMAASCPEREKLPDIRKGEYEALPEKMKDPFWKPDYGPAEFNPRSGATVIGVRRFLIAYNVNLNTTRKQIASEIGLEIRESGRDIKDEDGKKLKDAAGNSVKKPGLLKHVQATGWYIDEYRRAQVTINILNHEETPLHIVYETVRQEAEKRGARVTGSELVGLIPKEAMISAGNFYLDRMGLSRALPEREIIHTAVVSMGLSELAPFDIDKKIIEYHFCEKGLKDLTVTNFCDELASDSPAPGGGSAAALLGALAASLSAMVTNLTYHKKEYSSVRSEMGIIGEKAQKLKHLLLLIIDEDTSAFNLMAEAARLPKSTPQDREKRDKAMQEASRNGMLVPLKTMKYSLEALRLIQETCFSGNRNTLSDSGVACCCAKSAITGAYYNVLINAPSVTDLEFTENILRECSGILKDCSEISGKITDFIESTLSSAIKGC